MKIFSLALALLVGGAFVASSAIISPDSAEARITKTNKGGNQPQGEAKGIPATNPAGHAPPGHNK